MIGKILHLPVVLALAILMQGCASMPPSDPPTVTLTGIKPELSKSAPRFILSLRVVNPNDRAIELAGAAYSLALNDFDVVSGATSDLPIVPAYGEAEFELPAQLSLFDSVRLATSFISKSGDPLKAIDYEVKIKLDTGGLWPAIRFTEAGQLNPEDLLKASGNGRPL
ncbi:LEA type 2 family protein [Neiella marina]|uniref:LEA type 2 family protein n=1 Tax=Neiella holothuriorum TaxID=2870530 RepID=A0ABS7EIQ4_9GAMM|nr:LEA type 2 family protein [Neiella holothuriorum]MBW8191768.1 LEA type 2 family protein [Neiella holothuriorum]